MGTFKRTVKKAYKGAKKAIKSRYGLNKRSSGIKYSNIASDVMMLKKIVNSEKKSYQQANTILTVAQANINNTGASCIDITPFVTQGTGADQRTGNSFKLSSALYQFQISSESSQSQTMKLIFDFWVVKGIADFTTVHLPLLFTVSTFSGVIDTNSPRNQDRFSDYQHLRSVTRYLKGDQISGATTFLTFNLPTTFNRGKGHHIRLKPSVTGVPADVLNGQMLMTIRADIGNANTTTGSTLPIAQTPPATGAVVRFAQRVWYYDN